MKIGILLSSSANIRFSGANQTSILLGELFLTLGYDVIFIDTASGTWWEDVPRIQGTSVTSLYEAEGLDVLIDVDGTVAPDERKRIAHRTIVFLRSFLQFTEMDAAVYPEVPYVPRSMKGVHEIWCWDLLNPSETIPSIQSLFPCPIRRVPFVWSSSITDWMSKGMKAVEGDSNNEWIIHIAEKNNHNTSSAVLPLVAIRELVSQKAIPAKYLCHHVDAILQNRFLKENVLDNIDAHGLPLVFMPTEQFADWIQWPSHALFSHTRFLPLRTSLIQALWMGLPLIHNSPVLRDLHPLLAKTYYKGNNVQEMAHAFQWLHANTKEWYASQEMIRQAIGQTWGVLVHTNAWRDLTQQAFTSLAPAVPAVPAAPAAPAVPAVPAVPAASVTTTNTVEPAASVTTTNTVEPVTPVKKHVTFAETQVRSEILIGFSDMWPGFNAHSNFIMDALRHEEPSYVFRGISYESCTDVHLLIAGPFGTSWKSCVCPLVFFTGESWDPPEDERFRLYLTSSPKEDDRHMRIPIWMMFIDWYSNATVLPSDSQDNPIRLPLHFATNPHPVSFEERLSFCAFVVSNPTCVMRNEAFQALHSYRLVTSGGALFNNIGGPLALKYPGGGSGDLSKHAFFSQHRFSLSFENKQADGYITEKVLHAKMAGCVPLYWGDANTDSDFAPNSILNLSRMGSASQIVDIVRQLETNPTVCATIASTPLLNEEKKEKAFAILKTMSRRILALLPSAVASSATASSATTSPLERIQKTFVINLDSRRDRWDSLVESEPALAPFLTRLPAVYGKSMTLNPFLYGLFEHNLFQWKKSVMACILSHMAIWSEIIQDKEHSDGYYLILEDDVRFREGWQTTWAQCAASIPADADLLYLGGVLPPNLPALPLASESVNAHWRRIIPNTLFSSALAPTFHFCTYSYVLTKRGAQRLMSYLIESNTRCFVACDHLLGHPSIGLVKYVCDPLLTYCYQESDPAYVNASFNDTHKSHQFDSDIQNDVDCFTETDLAPFRVSVASPSCSSLSVYYDSNLHPGTYEIYEQRWLENMMCTTLVPVPFQEETLDRVPAYSWFIVQRPYSSLWNTRFEMMNRQGRDFYVLHLSDEFANDTIDFYSFPHCKGVIRNYYRADCVALPHILTIPLGYHYAYTDTITPFADRSLLWSFHGTDWFDRKTQLERLASFIPYNCLLLPSWNHPAMTKEKDYMNLLGKTKFCPILRGNNMETFRVYEALEAGCVPVFMDAHDPFLDRIDREMDLSSLYAWKDPVATIPSPFQGNIQQEVIRRWNAWKERVRGAIKVLLGKN